MADERATFALDLEGNLKQNAESDAQAIERLQAELLGGTQALRGMQQALRNLQGGKSVDIATTRKLRDEMAATKAKIANTQQGLLQLGGTAKGLPKPVKEAGSSFSRLADAVQKSGGPLGSFAGRLEEVSKLAASGVIVAGIAAIAAALVALTAATLAAAAATALYGLRQADARRSELLRLEGLTKLRYGMFGMMGGFQRAAESSGQLQANLDAVTATVALSRGEVAKYQEQLYKMGLRGRNLQDALQATATTAAVQGDAAAQAFAGWAAGANATGQSVRKLADDVKARLGGIARAQLLSLSTQLEKFRENIDHLFDGLKIQGILEAIHTVLGVFAKGQAVATALRGMIERTFKAFGAGAPDAGLAVKRFLQGIILGLLKVENVVLRARIWWAETFGVNKRKTDSWREAVQLGKIAAFGLAAAVLLVGAAFAITLIPIYAFGKALIGAYKVGKVLVAGFSELVGQAYDAGKNLIAGVGNGIKAGINYVVRAASEAASSAINAFKSSLQIRSPSVKMRLQVGRPISAGVAAGMHDERRTVERAGRGVAGAAVRGATVIDLGARMRRQPPGAPNAAARFELPPAAAPAAAEPPPQRRQAAAGQAAQPPVSIQVTVQVTIDGGASGGTDEARIRKIAEEAGRKGAMAGVTEAMRGAAISLGAAA